MCFFFRLITVGYLRFQILFIDLSRVNQTLLKFCNLLKLDYMIKSFFTDVSALQVISFDIVLQLIIY